MKRIIAFIRKNMLDDVVFALHRIENFPGATIAEVRRIGRGIHGQAEDAERTTSFGFPVSIKLEVVCSAEQADEIVETIVREAHTGLPDDGTVVVCPVDEVKQI